MRIFDSRAMVIAFCLGLVFIMPNCGFNDGDDDSGGASVDEAVDDTGDDSFSGDDAGDDDSEDDATDDGTPDDTGDDTVPDDYVAPWPRSNVETQDYPEEGELGLVREKARAYDDWHLQHHQPYYGSTLEIQFQDDTRQVVTKYEGTWDSCFWTGMYLASQSFRYYVTGDSQARTNAIKAVEALDGHLHITGKTGYLARFRGPQDPLLVPDDCATFEGCHLVDDGDYQGDFWIGNTSRDQYHGFMMGMVLAYDLVEDEGMRQMIREDITEILDYAISSHWIIVNWEAEPHSSPNIVLPNMQLLWSLIGYHITGEQRYKAVVAHWLLNENRPVMVVSGISWFSRYMEYYGNNLAHELFYNLLRLGKVYFSEDDFDYFRELYEGQVNHWVALSHNPFFALVHMSQGDYAPEQKSDAYQSQLEQDLTDFIAPPSYQRGVVPQPVTLDPVSVRLTDFFAQHPGLSGLLGVEIQYQSLEAYPILEQCPTHLFWENDPFLTVCPKPENASYVYPGFDFLFAYWMANYHKFISRSM
jgi:hypothetical protein